MQVALTTGLVGRSAALGLTALVLASVWFGAVMPLVEWRDQRAETLARSAAVEYRMAELAAALPTLREQARAVGAGGTGQMALLEASDDSTASALLQQLLQLMFMPAAVQLNSVETLPSETTGVYRRIRLRVSFNASWAVLVEILRDIHLATPVLLVDEWQVQPALHRISTAPGTFDVTVTISAFRSNTTTDAVR